MANNHSIINVETKVTEITILYHIHLKILLNSVQDKLVVAYAISLMRMSSTYIRCGLTIKMQFTSLAHKNSY